jgi:hypothetical protein
MRMLALYCETNFRAANGLGGLAAKYPGNSITAVKRFGTKSCEVVVAAASSGV